MRTDTEDHELKKWTVTMNRWDVYVIHDVEAVSREEAEEIAHEWFEADFNVDHEDGGINSVEAVEEEA